LVSQSNQQNVVQSLPRRDISIFSTDTRKSKFLDLPRHNLGYGALGVY
jgi:hypothetical protein